MANYVVRRVRFQNGEHHSVLIGPRGLPVLEVTLYLRKYRTKGRAANTIYSICSYLGLLYRELAEQKIDLFSRLSEGRFLTISELDRLALVTQYKVQDLVISETKTHKNVITLSKIAMRRSKIVKSISPVDIATQASRLRYIADFLDFLSRYVASGLSVTKRAQLESETEFGLNSFKEQIPKVSKRAKLDARVGLSSETQDLLLGVAHPKSPKNPWSREYVRTRNWLIIVLLLASGMRRGELLGLQIGDLIPNEPKLRILRRADTIDDPRRRQPCTKTSDREIELSRSIMKALWSYIDNERMAIKAARRVPQIFVSESGVPMSLANIGKIFIQLREASPDLPTNLTSHVMRHTWNERFSEKAYAMDLPEILVERARKEQQGWSDESKMAEIYTRKFSSQKGNEISLKLQERLDSSIQEYDGWQND